MELELLLLLLFVILVIVILINKEMLSNKKVLSNEEVLSKEDLIQLGLQEINKKKNNNLIKKTQIHDPVQRILAANKIILK